jgi:signal transduction histidine kinase
MGFYDRFNEQGIKMAIHLPDEEIVIIADESAVKRVIENLLLNAVVHSSGSVSVHLEKRHSTAVLTISNEAKHVTEFNLGLLFNRFYKADQTRSGKGTGLGLSIAKSLMLKMDGKLSAELKAGRLHMKCEWKLSTAV